MKMDSKADIPVFSLVGWSGSGKTSLIEHLIPCLQKEGLSVAVVKHDGHDDFVVDRENTDSARISSAGAEITAVVSSERGAVMINRPVAPEQLIKEIKGVNIILTEGFKEGKWPKILVYRRDGQKGPALDPDTCFIVVTDTWLDTKTVQFLPEQSEEIARYLVNSIPSA